jgi:hypothetical protein
MEIYDLKSINKLPDPEWIIDNILPANSCTIIYGQPGCGKTFLALDICFNIAYNKKWHNHNINKTGLIFYFLGEGVAGIKKRINGWHEYNNIMFNEKFHLGLINTVVFWDKENINSIITSIRNIEKKLNQKTVLIVVDTLTRASVGLDENSTKDMGLFLNKIEYLIKEIKASVMLVHHCGKDVTKGMRGSSALLGAIDTSILVTKSDNIISVKTIKQKDGEPVELKMELCSYKNTMVIKDKEIINDDFEEIDTANKGSGTNDDWFEEADCEEIQRRYATPGYKSEERTKKDPNEDDDIASNIGKKWSLEEEQKMIKLIKSGKSFKETAEEMTRNVGGIKSRFKNILLRDISDNDAEKMIKKYNIVDKADVKYIRKYID